MKLFRRSGVLSIMRLSFFLQRGFLAGTLGLCFWLASSNCEQAEAKATPMTFTGTETSRLWPRLDLDQPGLATVKAKVAADDSAGAMQALNAYYIAKFPKEDAVKGKLGKGATETADEAITFHFKSRSSTQYYLLHKDFEWNKNPEGAKDHHWVSLLDSQGDLEIVANTYAKTGDEKYAKGFAAIFDDWADHCPPGSQGPSWSLATTMIREEVFLRIFQRMVHWQNWPVEQEARFLNFIAMQADIMASKRGPGNQDCTNSEILLRTAHAFPEFKNASSWSQTGFDRLNGKILDDTLADGSAKEMCSGYHLGAVTTYTNVLHDLQAAGKPVSPDFTDRLAKMYEWLMKMARPDGVTPTNGDSEGSNIRSHLLIGADLFNRPDLAYVGSDGKKGTAPAYLDASLPVGGYYTMRTSWTDPEGLYLFMDISTQPVASHQYFDALHIFVYGFGRDFFPATGTFTYGGDYHATARATKSANTVVVDGKDQGDVPSVCHSFFSSDQLSFLDGSQEGNPGITHRRQVLFVRPGSGIMPYFLVIDRVTGAGSHKVDQYFHFPPGTLQVDAAKAQVQTTFASGGNIVVANLLTAGLTTDMFPDEMHPKQGITVARPGVRFHREGDLPMTFVTLLLPYSGITPPSYTASVLPAGSDKDVPSGNDTVAVQVKYGSTEDVLYASTDPVSVPSGDKPARAGLIRTIDGARKQIAVP